jgi:hypothetical protein
MVSSTLLTLIVIPAVFGLVRGRGLPSGAPPASGTEQDPHVAEPAVDPGRTRVSHQEKAEEMSI